ncbi:MAG: AAA family ATPase [Spirochaetales bacterium]|nr:AAA family ATPase [Spirochaetales bacterium]
MFLKSIELFGFKSFADRSKIEFIDGITALLGPNGCGKSNIVDAIKWVLGEQSTKTLRAEKMEDVIFNGTESRKPLNIAEVTLVLSNDSGMLNLDVPEISIKRRLYRSGDSEYYVNNTPVKLKELRELFFDTGVGKSAYSIMEQGKIDQVISNKPEERRHIFEEAAGITRYRVRSAEAERKLEKTEENMRQVDSIIGEVKKSYESLKIQSSKTEKYRALKDQVFAYELDIQLLRLKGFLDSKDKTEDDIKSGDKRKSDVEKEIASINDFLKENTGLVNSMESELIEKQKKLYGIGLEKDNKKNQHRMLEDRKKEIERQIESCMIRDKALKEKIFSVKDQITDKQNLLKEIDERLSEVGDNITLFEDKIRTAAGTIRENEKLIIENEEDIKESEKRQHSLQADLRNITEDIVKQLDKSLKDTGYSQAERKTAEESMLRSLEELRIILEGRIRILNDSLELDITDEKEYLNFAKAAKSAFEEGFEKLKIIKSSFETYNRTVPVFIDEFLAPEGIITRKRGIDNEITNLFSRVADLREKIRELQTANRELTIKIENYRSSLEGLKVEQGKMKTQQGAFNDSIRALAKNIEDYEKQIKDNNTEAENCNIRIGDISVRIDSVITEEKALIDEEKKLHKELSVLESGISKKNSDLVNKERQSKEKRKDLEKYLAQIEKLQMDRVMLETEIRNIYDNFRENYSRDLSEYESRIFEITVPLKDLKEKLREIKEEIRLMGQINLMAPEEFAEVRERYDFLKGQMDDLVKAKEDLKKITKEIKIESEQLFLETFDQIKKNFYSIFRRLFGGGRAEVRLSDDQNVLTSGIDIFVQPPGKKLENITLLSGGERALTGVALLFATFMVKPSPFCVLDEIDAALDESNVGKFVNILTEFGSQSQFVVITHNKKTVTGAKTFLGVTMEESGISRIISFRVDKGGEAQAG